MTNNIILPPDIESLVRERSKIWAAYDAAAQDASTVNSLGYEIGTSGEAAEISNLTADATPPLEINAAIAAYHAEKKVMESLEVEINKKLAEIEAIRSHVTTMYVSLGIITVIIIAFLIFWLRGMM